VKCNFCAYYYSSPRISLIITDINISKPTVAAGILGSRVKEAYPTEYRQRGGTYKVSLGMRSIIALMTRTALLFVKSSVAWMACDVRHDHNAVMSVILWCP
jgi:hypothetical protein